MTILLVDDSQVVRERMGDMLSEIPGVDAIYHTQNVADTQKQLEKVTPDIVILDIRLPDGSGFNILQKIKADTPKTVVIMLTNYALEQYRTKAKELRADYFFDKSGGIERITNIIEDLVSKEKKLNKRRTT